MIKKNMGTLVMLGALLFLLPAASRGRAQGGEEEGLASTLELMNAVGAIDGIRVVPAPDIPTRVYTEDYGPSQVLEIIRPDMGPVTVSRLATTCSCVHASMVKKTYAQGERAFVEIRNVKPSVAAGAEYGVFVVLNSPYRVALQAEVFVKSDRKPGESVP